MAFHFGFDRRIDAERAPAIARAEKLFKNLRLQGLEEMSLRQFVCKYSGSRWEEFFETLFGYEAKLAAREWSRGEMGKERETFAAWREPIIAWIDARRQARKAARERKQLQEVEVKALQAEGMNAAEAEAKAGQIADEMVDQAAALKAPPTATAISDEEATAALPAIPAPPANLKQMLETARRPEKLFTLKPRRTEPGLVSRFFAELFGPRPRFLMGAVLLFGFLGWLFENDLLAMDKLLNQINALSAIFGGPAQDVGAVLAALSPARRDESLRHDLRRLRRFDPCPLRIVREPAHDVRSRTGGGGGVRAPWAPEWYGLPSMMFLVGGLTLALLGFLFLWRVYYRGSRRL